MLCARHKPGPPSFRLTHMDRAPLSLVRDAACCPPCVAGPAGPYHAPGAWSPFPGQVRCTHCRFINLNSQEGFSLSWKDRQVSVFSCHFPSLLSTLHNALRAPEAPGSPWPSLGAGTSLQKVLSSFRLNGFRKGLHRSHVSSDDSLLSRTFRLFILCSAIRRASCSDSSGKRLSTNLLVTRTFSYMTLLPVFSPPANPV